MVSQCLENVSVTACQCKGLRRHHQKRNRKAGGSAQQIGQISKASTIGSTTSGVTNALTFAFHVRSTDVIKCYLCFNGQIIRFMAQDIKQLLPKLFNMSFHGNKDFVNSKE